MKVAFPVDILSPKAAYHIQFAAIERATHDNTEFDRARFEVPAHYWADISEADYGTALMNDCKYGYDVKDNVLRLSLLRSSADPDPDADKGVHEMSYALYPHEGDWRYGVVQQGYEFNHPLIATVVGENAAEAGSAGSLASFDAENIIVESIKRAEDSDTLILRVYEAYGQRGAVEMTLGFVPRQVEEVDMMEENPVSLRVKEASAGLYFTPFEIKTLRVSL